MSDFEDMAEGEACFLLTQPLEVGVGCALVPGEDLLDPGDGLAEGGEKVLEGDWGMLGRFCDFGDTAGFSLFIVATELVDSLVDLLFLGDFPVEFKPFLCTESSITFLNTSVTDSLASLCLSSSHSSPSNAFMS